MTHPIFNSENFLSSLAGDKELACELLAAFMEDSPERSASLKEALVTQDGGAISRLAHSLKGMCGVVRAEELVGLALNMENASKNGDLEKTEKIYTEFAAKLSLAHEEMQAFIAA